MKTYIPSDVEKSRAFQVIEILKEKDFFAALNYTKVIKKTYSGEEYEDWELSYNKWLSKEMDNMLEQGIEFSSGLTKVCIFDKQNPHWNIKVSFNRSSCPSYQDPKLNIDFCKREADYYAEAEACDLGQYFTATYPLETVNGLCVVLQQNVETAEDIFDEILDDYVRDWYKVEDFDGDEDAYWDSIRECANDLDNSERIRAIIGEDSAALIEFIEKYNINDLHVGNWGITDQGYYVMLDFSGYVA